MWRKVLMLAGLLGVLGTGCGGPLEEGDLVERSAPSGQGEALTGPLSDPTAPVQAGTAEPGATAQNSSVIGAAANLPGVNVVSDSQDPIPITDDGRPVSGGAGGGNPDPGDPRAFRGATARSAVQRR